MLPQRYIRLILSPPTNVSPNSGLRNQTQFVPRGSASYCGVQPTSIKLLNGSLSATAVSASERQIFISTPSTPRTFTSETNSLKPSEPTSQASIVESPPVPLPAVVKNHLNVATTMRRLSCSSVKRVGSSCARSRNEIKKKSMPKTEVEERAATLSKRNKNWKDDETIAFIGVWVEHQPKLEKPESRNTPIYNGMAEELSELLNPRCLTGHDVKTKIGNLSGEYRRRKTEQIKTGGSPCTWRYYDLLDKLLGERPFNNQKLLFDSMLFDKETLLMDDDENSILHSTSTQIAKEADGHSRSQLIPDLTISPIHSSSGESTSALMISSISKASTPLKKSVVLKKTVLTKKKKNSNMKTDLIQQLLGKIEDTGETAATAETKIFDLFQKQTQLQKESVDNEREFLLIFKSIMTNMASNG